MRTLTLPLLTLTLFLSAGCSITNPDTHQDSAMPDAIQVHYLEIVTPDVDAVCDTLATANGVSFSAPVPELGNARTAELSGGGMVGVRAPMNPTERPVTRPYWLVDDIEAAVAEAERAGAAIALPPMHVPGQGTFAIYFHGDTEHGLWQLDAE